MTEKVSGVHKPKNQRLKQTNEEPQAEIEQYHLQRKKEFKAKEAVALGFHGSCSSEVRDGDPGEDGHPRDLLPAEQG